jgi:hypothetical protein
MVVEISARSQLFVKTIRSFAKPSPKMKTGWCFADCASAGVMSVKRSAIDAPTNRTNSLRRI